VLVEGPNFRTSAGP